jgi:hypothetical protein
MTTPAAPGAPEGGQSGSEQPAPGAQPQSQPEQAPAPGAPAAQPGEGTSQQQDVSALPDWAQKMIRDARGEAAKARTTAKQQAADEAVKKVMGDIGKALGLEGTEEPLPEHIKQKLDAAQAAQEAAEGRAVELAYQSTVSRVASQVGADAEALLDSGSFRDAVAEELGEDFTDGDLRAAVEKVAKEYAKKPRFATASTAPPRGGADINGGPTPPPRKRPGSLHDAIKATLGGS